MSTSIINDPMVMTGVGDVKGPVNTVSDVDLAKCDCCGLTEECTLSYIETIQQRYGGKWICGLCAEAVKDEILRCQKLEEAMARHFSFCNKFRASGPPQDPTLLLIRAMRKVLRKGLEIHSLTNSRPDLHLELQSVVLTHSQSSVTLVD